MIRRQCFSLLELMIALAMLALVLGLILPRFELLPFGLRVKNNNGSINAAFYAAGAMAQSTGTTVKLRFEIDGDKPRVRIDRPTAERLLADAAVPMVAAAGDTLEQPRPSIFRDMELFELDLEFKLDEERLASFAHETSTEFSFYPNGEADGPDLPFLMGDVPFTLTVDRLTGRPFIKEEEQ